MYSPSGKHVGGELFFGWESSWRGAGVDRTSSLDYGHYDNERDDACRSRGNRRTPEWKYAETALKAERDHWRGELWCSGGRRGIATTTSVNFSFQPISLLSISDPLSDSADSAVPCIAEHPEEGKEEAENKTIKGTEDETKLRPHVQKTSWATTKSLSRESNGTEYSDRAGTDLRSFVFRTMHKSEEDRNNLLQFEKELTKLIMDTKWVTGNGV